VSFWAAHGRCWRTRRRLEHKRSKLASREPAQGRKAGLRGRELWMAAPLPLERDAACHSLGEEIAAIPDRGSRTHRGHKKSPQALSEPAPHAVATWQ
jgi:hypothetical protein